MSKKQKKKDGEDDDDSEPNVTENQNSAEKQASATKTQDVSSKYSPNTVQQPAKQHGPIEKLFLQNMAAEKVLLNPDEYNLDEPSSNMNCANNPQEPSEDGERFSIATINTVAKQMTDKSTLGGRLLKNSKEEKDEQDNIHNIN